MNTRASVVGIFLALVLGTTLAVAHQGTLGSSKQKKVADANAPVTHKEAAAIITKIEQTIRRVVYHTTPKGMSKIATDGKPVQRTEILREFNRLFELCRPKFKFTPDMTSYDAKDFNLGTDATAKAEAGKLVGWGVIGRVAPLVSGTKPTVSVAEFGDAVGFFLLRISELTHTPSIKFSPPMMSGG